MGRDATGGLNHLNGLGRDVTSGQNNLKIFLTWVNCYSFAIVVYMVIEILSICRLNKLFLQFHGSNSLGCIRVNIYKISETLNSLSSNKNYRAIELRIEYFCCKSS